MAFKANHKGTHIFALPGVPREFKAIAEESLLPFLSRGENVREVIKVVGWPESTLKDKVKGLLDFEGVKLSILPSPNCVTLSLWGKPEVVTGAVDYVQSLIPEDILPQGASSLAEAVLIEAEKSARQCHLPNLAQVGFWELLLLRSPVHLESFRGSGLLQQ